MKTLFLSLSLCFALDAVQSALAAVRVGAGRGAPCATVPVPVAFTAPTGAVSMQFDLSFGPSALSGVGAAGGKDLKGFRVDGFPAGVGSHRVLLWSPENKPLPTTGTLSVLLYIATNAPPTNALTVTGVLVSTATGGALGAGISSNGVVTVGPTNDAVLPKVTITAPAANARLVSADGIVNVRGTVKDNVGVCDVRWRLNGGAEQGSQVISTWQVVHSTIHIHSTTSFIQSTRM